MELRPAGDLGHSGGDVLVHGKEQAQARQRVSFDSGAEVPGQAMALLGKQGVQLKLFLVVDVVQRLVRGFQLEQMQDIAPLLSGTGSGSPGERQEDGADNEAVALHRSAVEQVGLAPAGEFAQLLFVPGDDVG